MLATGTHVLVRVKSDIPLRRTGEFAPDGSYPAELTGSGVTLAVRVIEYTVTVAGRGALELFCLVTDLHEHAAYPAEVLAAAYHRRWIGSEICLKEAKSAISVRGAVNRGDAPVGVPRPGRAGARRLGHRHRVGPRRPAALTRANRESALARRRVQVDRDRHRDRKTKARPGFPAGGPRLPTQTAPARIAVCGPIAA